MLRKLHSDFPGYAAAQIKLPRGCVDNWLSYLPFSLLAFISMLDGTVYYCWSCDAHRKAVPGADSRPACPRCGQPLTEDSRLSRGAKLAEPAPFGYWSAAESPAAAIRRRVG